MDRTLKRVPLNFAWPLNKEWEGYINPFFEQSIECPNCEGSGSSPQARRLEAQWYGNAPFYPEDRGSIPWRTTDKVVRDFAQRNVNRNGLSNGTAEEAIEEEAERLCSIWNNSWNHHLNDLDVAALVAAGRLSDLTHTWTKEDGWQPKIPPYVPSAREVNEWSIRSIGHDCINQWICVEAECKRLGHKTTCDRCAGEGRLWPTPKIKKSHEEWKQTEPPSGTGFQIWETNSKGSPISPVLETIDALCEWCARNTTIFGDLKASAAEWKKTLDRIVPPTAKQI